jgi:rare lipoprotein A
LNSAVLGRHAGVGFLMAAFLAGCSGGADKQNKQRSAGPRPPAAGLQHAAVRGDGRPQVKVGSPYQIKGVWYYPHHQPDYDETGIASWYGEPFHGRPTANGEVYDKSQLTAAHRTLPLPSRVMVTNLENGRTLMVRINDRGPFAHGRIIDLSERAAELLQFHAKGTARVRVQLLQHTVVKDSFVAPKTAITAQEKALVVAVPQGDVKVAALPPPSGVAEAPPNPSRPLPKPVAGAATSFLPAADGRAVNGVGSVAVTATDIFVQVGAFNQYQNALRLQVRLRTSVGRTKIEHGLIDDKDIYRVRVGPAQSVAEADRLLEQAIAMGYKGARIIVD